MQLAGVKQTVLFLTGRKLSRADYREIETRLSTEVHLADSLGQAFESLLVQPYAAVVLTEQFVQMDLLKVCAAIRATRAEIPLIIVGNTAHETMNRILARFDQVQFNETENSVSELLITLRSAERAAKMTREVSPRLPRTQGEKMTLSEWIFGEKTVSKTDVQLRTAQRVLQQLLHSSSQGRGLGALITYLELMETTATPDQDRVSIDKKIFESLVDNAMASREWLNNIERALIALSSNVPAELVSGHDFAEIMKRVLEESNDASKIKRHVLAVDFLSLDGRFEANMVVLPEVIHELIINALKYSPVGSLVRLTAGFAQDEFLFAIQNDYDEREYGGLSGLKAPKDALAAPFVKLKNEIDDRFAGFRYGIGIGLTICAHKIRQMGGELDLTVESIEPTKAAVMGFKRLKVMLKFPHVH